VVAPQQLVDDAARTQIATDLGSRLFVDAGAGSGKTTALVERIVSLVCEEGLAISSIAAITFTEAAAAELRLRVRRRLSALSQTEPRLRAAAREVDDAAISTIHAFALRILSEYWLESGLPPNIEVLDSAGEYLDHKTRWRQFTNDLLDDPTAAPTLFRGFASGLRLSQLSEIGHAMADHSDRLTPAVLRTLDAERTASANPVIGVADVLAPLERAMALVHRCGDVSDGLYGHLVSDVTDAIRRLRRLDGSEDEATLISLLGDLGKLSFAAGRKENWDGVITEVRAACREAEMARERTLISVRESVVADLAWRMASWAVRCQRERVTEGRFTFHDLLVESCRILRGDPAVLGHVRARYRCLLIDEFQDTDPLQAELAHLLGSPDAEDLGPARLFVVGDPEQSIYRFRRADVAQFEATVARMDERLSLMSNFRSVPAILDFVDAIFGELSPGGANRGVPHRSLAPTRPSPPADGPGGPTVAVFGGPHLQGRARDVRLEATAQVAKVIRAILDDGWAVEGEEGSRPARYRDIAVLMPTRTGLAMLERAFDTADVPYRLEGATLLWASQDIRDVLAVARAVDDPANPVAVVAALRTPALACGDDDLVRFHAAGGSWDPRAERGPGIERGDPVASAMRVLAELHERRMWLDAPTLVSSIMTDLRFFELALVHRRPRDHWQRLRWLLDQVSAFDEARGGTLGDFLDWVDLSEEAERWTSSLGAPDPDDDAVRVMTVHGSKGLEFPIVVLTGLDSAPSGVSPSMIFDTTGVPRFRFVGDFRSPTYEAASNGDKALDKEERLRLLYVALTRARDHLLVDLNHKDGTKEALATALSPICLGMTEGPARIVPGSPPTAPTLPERVNSEGHQDADEGDSHWWSDHERWSENRRKLLAAGSRQTAWSATALSAAVAESQRERDGPRQLLLPLRGPNGEDPENQRRIGRAVHDALAKIRLPRSGDLSKDDERIADASARAQHLDDTHAALVVALVRRAVASPTVLALAAGRHWKELPLAAPLRRGDGPPDAPVLEGFADLVGESDEGLVVVDFKTAASRSSSAQYLFQVAAYAHALREATGRGVTKVSVLYLSVDGAEEEALVGEELEAAIAAMLEAARGG